MNSILVVGSVALDSVETRAGKSEDALGGSATYFSLAARQFAPVKIVGVIGEDFPARHRSMLEKAGIDISGLETAKGKTFRWSGSYTEDYNAANTLDTQLNVFAEFDPKLSDEHKECPILFLANIDPELQMEVLSQMKGPKIVAADTMNFWIDSKKPAVKELLGRVDVLFVNEQEAQSLSGADGNVAAAKVLSQWGPSVVVVKKGEHGALVYAGGKVYPFPAFPKESISDPTGAGDSFGGGFMGALAANPDLTNHASLKRAAVYGAVTASFNVESFSTERLEGLSREELDARAKEYVELLSVDFETAAV
jgi:sugar/nucleoside kinase (ribokinase family)